MAQSKVANNMPLVITVAVAGIILGLFVGMKLKGNQPQPQLSSAAPTETGVKLSGAHYNLNIIGVEKGKSANMTGGDGHRIFVSLGGKATQPVTSKINLSQSFDGTFQVLDANGTDGSAEFKLPEPGGYEIYARPLGKPGGRAQMTTCAMGAGLDGVFGTADDEEICSTAYQIFARETGGSKFRNVTTTLTSIVLDEAAINPATGVSYITECGSDTVSLFNPCLQSYFWNYDNQGLRLLQLRFYKI